MSFEKILFYGIIIVGALLLIGLTYYRIDWAPPSGEIPGPGGAGGEGRAGSGPAPGHAQAQQEKAEIKQGRGRLRWKSLPLFMGHCRAVRRRGSAHKDVFFQPVHGLPHQGMGQGGVDADAVAVAEARPLCQMTPCSTPRRRRSSGVMPWLRHQAPQLTNSIYVPWGSIMVTPGNRLSIKSRMYRRFLSSTAHSWSTHSMPAWL